MSDVDQFTPERWTLTIEFDPPNVQEERNPALVFPFDEASMIVNYVTGIWSEYDDDDESRWIKRGGETVEITIDMLDPLIPIMELIATSTVPLRMELKRRDRED